MFFGNNFDVFGFLLWEGVLLHFFDGMFRHGKPTFETIRNLFSSIEATAHLSTLFELDNCAYDYLCGHNVFAAHYLVFEIIEYILIFVNVSPPHRLHSADFHDVTSLHFSFPIDALNHINEMLAFQFQ